MFVFLNPYNVWQISNMFWQSASMFNIYLTYILQVVSMFWYSAIKCPENVFLWLNILNELFWMFDRCCTHLVTHTGFLNAFVCYVSIWFVACGKPTHVKRVLDGTSPQQRIVGGVNAVEGEWPWQVSMHFSGQLYCGASVLSDVWLISAAHCYSKERWETSDTSINHWISTFNTFC